MSTGRARWLRLKRPPTDEERAARRQEKALKSEIADAVAVESRLVEVQRLMERDNARAVRHSVMLQGVDSSVDEGKLRVACGAFGPIVDVHMAKVGSVPVATAGHAELGTAGSIARSLHCAIIDFKNAADADASAEALNGAALFGSIVQARRAEGEGFKREHVSEHLAKVYAGEAKEVQAYGLRGGAFADCAEASPKPGPPKPSPEQVEVASAAEEILQQMEAAHSMGRQLHPRELEFSEPALDKNPKVLHDEIHSRLEVVKRAISDADEDFASGHYKLLNAANQEVAVRSKFRLEMPELPEDDPADAMAPTMVAALTARSHRTTKPQVTLPAPPEAMKPRPPSLLDALRKRHIRMGRQTKEIWSNPETLDGGSIFTNIDNDVDQDLAVHEVEVKQRFVPPEPEPEVSSLSDTVKALIVHYEPTPGESDGEESVESVPDDVILGDDVIQVVLELYTLKRRLAEERAALEARKSSLEDARKSVADYKAAMDADQDAAAKARDEMARLAIEVKRTEEELGKVMRCESAKAEADGGVVQAEGALAESTEQLAQLQTKQDEERAEQGRLAAALEDAEANAEAAKRKHDELNTALAEVEEEQRQVAEAEKEQQKLAEEVASAEAAAAATESRLTELRDEETQNQAEDERLSSEIANAEAIAEAGRLTAERLKKELEEAEKEIAVRRAEVTAELESLQPIVDAASKAVSSIKTSQLDEMKAMLKPPEGVRLTMESVMILLGKGKMEWAEIRKEVVQKGFIDSVLELDANNIKKKSTDLLKKTYLSNEVFQPEKIARASKAASPLCTWATAQVTYADALRQCKPLTDEVKRLQSALDEQRKAYDAAMAEIQLGSPEGIAKMKEEHEAVRKRLAELEAALPAVETMLEQQSSELASVTEEHGKASTMVSEMRPHEEVLANAEQLRKDLSEVQLGSPEEIAEMQAALGNARASVAALEEKAETANAGVAQRKAELEAASVKQQEAAATLGALRPKEDVQTDLETTQMSLLQIVWNQMDGNGDSVLDQSEMIAVLLVLEGEEKVKATDMTELFAEVDTNGNNEIDFEEFSDWFLREYREKLLELGAEGLLVPRDDSDQTLTQLEALTKTVERLETEVAELTATIAKLESKEQQARELLESLRPTVPTLDEHAHQSIKLITALPEWCREEEDSVLNWFAELLPSIQRQRYRTTYASDPVPEEPESSDEEVELLEGWVPLSSLTSTEGTRLTKDTCEVGMDIQVASRDELHTEWKSCDALGAWSREGAVFAGKTGYVVNLPYEWDESVYVRCPDFGMTAALAGLPETESEDEDDEEDEDDDEDEDDEEEEVVAEGDDEPVQWSTVEQQEFEQGYEQEHAVRVAGQEALDRVEQIATSRQGLEEAVHLKKKARELEAQSDFAGALEVWDKIAKLVPNDAGFRRSRDKAEKRCRIPLLLEQAHALLAEQKFLEAADALGKAQSLDPKNKKIHEAQQQAEKNWTAIALKKSGHKQMENGEYHAAQKSFAKAMALNASDQELVSLHEEASAVASHTKDISSSYVMIVVKTWFKALQAEVVASRKRRAEEAEAVVMARRKAEEERLAAEELAASETYIAATMIQSLFRGHLGRRQVVRLRARAAAAAIKQARAAERRAKAEEERQQRKLKSPKKKSVAQKSKEQKKDTRDMVEAGRLAAVDQFDGALGLLVEGVPNFEYNSVYTPDTGKAAAADGWPRWISAEGNMLFRCVADGEWHLDDNDSTAPAAYCETDDGKILIGGGDAAESSERAAWKCWSNGAWANSEVSVSPLYTEDEVAEHTERLEMFRQQHRNEARQAKAAAKAAARERKRAEAAAQAEQERAQKEARLERQRAEEEALLEKQRAEEEALLEKQRAEAIAEALAAKEAAAAEALATQVVPSWVVDKIMKVSEPGDYAASERAAEEAEAAGAKLPPLLDDALTEIHSEFLMEKEAMKQKLDDMGLGRNGSRDSLKMSSSNTQQQQPADVRGDAAVTGDLPTAEASAIIEEEDGLAAADLSSTRELREQQQSGGGASGGGGDAEEVEEEEGVVAVPPSPERLRQDHPGRALSVDGPGSAGNNGGGGGVAGAGDTGEMVAEELVVADE